MKYNACVIVDEAHGLGVYGRNGMGVLEECGLENHPSLLASIHTFGKAAGCHGAVVCGSARLKEFLYNYGPPVVYSTSLPLHSLVCIHCAYESMVGTTGKALRKKVFDVVSHFRKSLEERLLGSMASKKRKLLLSPSIRVLPSHSPIQALVIPGNNACVEFCTRLWEKSKHRILLYPIRSPTVPKGQERVRIILHSHNSIPQVDDLINLIEEILLDMNLLSEVASKL